MSTPTTTTQTFDISVPADQVTRIATAFCAQYSYPGATLPDGTANPVDPVTFTKQIVAQFIQNVVAAYEGAAAAEAARAQAVAAVQAQVVLS